MKVIATKESKEKTIHIKGIGILEPGKEYEMSEERVKSLMGDNFYGLKFVELPKSEKAKEEVKEEEPKKKGRKAKK